MSPFRQSAALGEGVWGQVVAGLSCGLVGVGLNIVSNETGYLGVLVVGALGLVATVWSWRRQMPRNAPLVRWTYWRPRVSVMGAAAGLLPGSSGERYAEEWAGELYDLRAEGARWWRRAGYVAAVLLYAAPRLAVTLRLSARRAVD